MFAVSDFKAALDVVKGGLPRDNDSKVVRLQFSTDPKMLILTTSTAAGEKLGGGRYAGAVQVRAVCLADDHAPGEGPLGLCLDMKHKDLTDVLKALKSGGHDFFTLDYEDNADIANAFKRQVVRKVTFASDNGAAAGGMKLTLPAILPDDPRGMVFVPPSPAPWKVEVAGGALVQVLERAVLFASSDETRPVLTGVFVHWSSDAGLSFVGTDTYRLFMQTVPLAAPSVTPLVTSWLLPKQWCKAVAKALKKSKVETVTLHLGGDDRSVLVNVGTSSFECRGMEGQFVNYAKVICPKTHRFVLPDSSALTAALGMVEAVASLDANRVCFRHLGAGKVLVRAEASDAEAESSFIVTEGEPFEEIAFNGKYLRQFLKCTDQTAPVVLEWEGPLNSANVSVGEALYVLMPMQII